MITARKPLKLEILPFTLAIVRLKADDAMPDWIVRSNFWNLTRSAEELSIVAEEAAIPSALPRNGNWVALKVVGPLDFALTGILSSIAGPLGDANISLFAISTFDTDYVLIKNDSIAQAKDVLVAAGHSFRA